MKNKMIRKLKVNKLSVDEQRTIVSRWRKIASNDAAERSQAVLEISQAIVTPLRQVLLSGDIVSDIFTPLDYTDNPRVEFPLDLLTPGDEANFYAFVSPGEGRIPEQRVSADYVMVPTYMISNAIDANLRLLRDAQWPIIARMMEVLEGGFVKKINDDGWQVLLSAGLDRNIVINDPNATAGQFTPRLITLLQTFMRRNAGGNSGSLNRGKLTDIYMSPEAHQDMRSWGINLISDAVRADIYYSDDQDLMNVYGVFLHALDELGEGQEYQLYYEDTLNGSMASGDVEIVVALDRQREDSFVRPIRQDVEVYEDNTLHRRGLFGMYGHADMGFAVLDTRRVLLGSL